MKKMNQKGFAHWVAPILVVAVVAAVGLYVVKATHADAAPSQNAFHWGTYFGDFNNADADPIMKPATMNLPATVTQVATSNSTEYALLSDGTVWAWGQGTNGQLGDGQTTNSFDTAVQVQFPAGVTIASLPTDAMPYDTGMALDTNGNAWGWGYNSTGQLCLNNKTTETTPVELPFTNVTTLAGAGDHAFYDSNGTVYACGGNLNDDLGIGTTKPSYVPAKVSGLANGSVTTLVAAFENGGALLTNGTYYDWGYNKAGQLGNGTTTDSSVPVQVSLPLPVTQVAQGGSYTHNGQTIVMLSDGSLRMWGDNKYGQLGTGKKGGDRTLPVQIYPPSGVTYKTLASGGSTTYAISTTGNVYVWGIGNQGELGTGSTKPALTPVQPESGMSLISATAANVVTAQ